MQRRAAFGPEPDAAEAPPIVHDVLRRPGRPLDDATRAFFEPRFGHDFSHVRVHTDARAAESATAVGALAYTVGRDVVFGAGQFAPHAPAGRRLMTHELTHVVQQRNVVSTATVELGKPGDVYESDAERTAAQVAAHIPSEASIPFPEHSSGTAVLSGVWVDCRGDEDYCPSRASGEYERSRTGALQAGTLTAPEHGFIVSHFAINSADASTLATNPTWNTFVGTLGAGRDRWEILGFSDCEGSLTRNEAIRTQRANAVHAALPPAAQANIDSVYGADLSDCVAANDTEANRSFNRSVVFRRTERFIEFPEEPIEVPRPYPRPATEDCELWQQRMLDDHLNSARTWIIDTEQKVRDFSAGTATPAVASVVRQALIDNFHTTAAADVSEIADGLAGLRRELLRSFTFECEDEGCADRAYVRGAFSWIRRLGDIHVCPPWFNCSDYFERVRTLIHERAHQYPGATDNAYNWESGYATLSPSDAIDNADSYAVAARQIYHGGSHGPGTGSC